MGRSRIAILICAFNEEKTIKEIINQAKKIGQVFLIDDGSTDKTSKCTKHMNINYFKNKKNIGYEKSLARGFKIILSKNFDYLVTMDADGQHKFNSLKEILLKIKRYDIVIGSRDKTNNFLEKILSFFSKKHLNLTDILCGLKAYRLNKYRNYKSSNPDIIGTNYLFYGINNGVRISEIKIKCDDRQHGNSRYYANISNYIKILQLILKIIRK